MLVDIAPKELSFVCWRRQILTTWRKRLSYVILHILVKMNILKLGPKIDKLLQMDKTFVCNAILTLHFFPRLMSGAMSCSTDPFNHGASQKRHFLFLFPTKILVASAWLHTNVYSMASCTRFHARPHPNSNCDSPQTSTIAIRQHSCLVRDLQLAFTSDKHGAHERKQRKKGS
jgi:hypothetical protein